MFSKMAVAAVLCAGNFAAATHTALLRRRMLQQDFIENLVLGQDGVTSQVESTMRILQNKINRALYEAGNDVDQINYANLDNAFQQTLKFLKGNENADLKKALESEMEDLCAKNNLKSPSEWASQPGVKNVDVGGANGQIQGDDFGGLLEGLDAEALGRIQTNDNCGLFEGCDADGNLIFADDNPIDVRVPNAMPDNSVAPVVDTPIPSAITGNADAAADATSVVEPVSVLDKLLLENPILDNMVARMEILSPDCWKHLEGLDANNQNELYNFFQEFTNTDVDLNLQNFQDMGYLTNQDTFQGVMDNIHDAVESLNSVGEEIANVVAAGGR